MAVTTKTEGEIELNGIKYIPKGSAVSKSANFLGAIKIVVLQRGWVYIGRLSKTGSNCKLANAYCIRTWGTTKGLPELVNGATTSTKLDKCEGIVDFHEGSVLFTIAVDESKWKEI